MTYLSSYFDFRRVSGLPCTLKVERLNRSPFYEKDLTVGDTLHPDVVSFVGHPGNARAIESCLRLHRGAVPIYRQTITLHTGDVLFVAIPTRAREWVDGENVPKGLYWYRIEVIQARESLELISRRKFA